MRGSSHLQDTKRLERVAIRMPRGHSTPLDVIQGSIREQHQVIGEGLIDVKDTHVPSHGLGPRLIHEVLGQATPGGDGDVRALVF